jgi:predicted ATPase/class 3 adenylate cyclase
MTNLFEWLDAQGLAVVHDILVENDVDLDILHELSDADLKDIGLSLGQRRRLMRAAAKESGDRRHSGAGTAAERRIVSVVFCDLVGSTEMSARLDPEDLRDVMRQYQDVVSGAVSRFGGHVAKFLGDGVLAYFGWPQAYEDQAERAVRASLAAIGAVQGVHPAGGDRALDARVGIATGEVVVGDLVGESGRDAEAVIGETPNMAARLQQSAQPGQVVVDPVTRDLLRQTFDLADLGGQELKGFAGSTPAWAVTGEGTAESRFAATRNLSMTPMVGRDQELSDLIERWRQACGGTGQAVLVRGEAGIGKSRLVETVAGKVAEEKHFRVRYQCSPFHVTSAFYPAVQQLQRAARISAGDDESAKFEKLERLLSRSYSNIKESWALFANLLSLPYSSRYGDLGMTPQQIKAATMEALFEELRLLSEIRPVLFIFEDAHWIDPTSLELLTLMVREISNARVLLLVTHRPEWAPPEWQGDHISSLPLSRLGPEDNATIARAVAGDEITVEAIESIVSRTDGVPLFVEELTKTLVESGLELTEAEIPATLQASLLARLDRLGQDAKEIAQIGAVIGRDFNYDLLTEVAGRTGSDLDAQLDRLARSELIFRHGSADKTYFTFKHALVQDATYGSLLKSRRQELHAEIAQTLEFRFADHVENQPELLAHHFASAGMNEKAISYWRRAAALAVSRTANQEAMRHFDEALTLLAELPDNEDRDRLELDMRVAQGVPVIAATGYSSRAVEEVYLRARELSEKLGDRRRMFPVVRGLWNLYVDRADLEMAVDYALALTGQAEEEEDLERMALAYRALGFSRIQTGETAAARKALTRAIEAMEQHGRPPDLQQYGENGGLAARQYLAWVQMFEGQPEQAAATSRAAVAQADEMNHAVSRAFSRGNAATVFTLRREPEEVVRLCDEMLDVTERHGLVFWTAHAYRNKGWALGQLGKVDDGLRMLAHASDLWDQTSALILKNVHDGFIAELHALAGQVDQGLAVLDECFQHVEQYGDRWNYPQLHHQYGRLLLSKGDRAQAKKRFETAIEIARNQGNRLWLLRVKTTLADLLASEGDEAAAKAMLEPIYRTFTEGHGTRDLTEARELLARLGAITD